MAATRTFVIVLAALCQIALAGKDSLRASPAGAVDKKLADTVRALDTNGNGKVDKSEITVFAKSQGLSAQEVLDDFAELDVNKDGALDTSEIGPLFGVADAGQISSAKETVGKEATMKTVAAEQPSLAAAPVAEATAKLASTVSTSSEEKELKAAEALATEAEAAPQQQSSGLTQSKITMGLDLVALERDAQNQAGGIIASQLAKRAQILLARSSVDEQKAEAFDKEVRTLRGDATALAKEANAETRKAAGEASNAISQKSLAKLKKLQQEEHKSEESAKERRLQASKAMQRVREAQASLRHS